MSDKELKYDPTNPESIEQYAVKLENKTFMEVFYEKGITEEEVILAYANKLRKGGLGNLLENHGEFV